MVEKSSGAWGEAVASTAVRDVLAANTAVREVRHVGEVGSTQDVVRDLAVAGASSGTVVVADLQRAGRGRSGNRWDDDPSGGSLALSLLLDVGAVPLGERTVPLLPLALGLAVVDACAAEGAGSTELRLKWPNDVVLRDRPGGPARKFAGILVERDRIHGRGGVRDVLRCGVGVNVTLPEPIPQDRVDLESFSGSRPDRPELLAAILRALNANILALAAPSSLLERVRGASDTIGRRVQVHLPGEGVQVGLATGIADDGRLLLATEGRTRAILSGTVRDGDDGGASIR